MANQLPPGFRFLDEEPAQATAPTLPPGFRFADEPAPDVPLPPRRPDDINALPDNPQPAAVPMPSARPAEFGSSYDDAGQFPSTPAPTDTGGALDQILGNTGKLTPEQGKIEQEAKAAAALKTMQDARANAARTAAAPPQIPTFSDGPPAQESEADVADQMATGAFTGAANAAAAPPPTLTPGRAAAQTAINSAGKAAVGIAKPIGQMNADLGAPQFKDAIAGAERGIDSAFPTDPGRADEMGQQVAGAVGGLVPFIAGGAVAKGLGVSAEGVTAAIGALQGGGSGYEAAEKAGAGTMARYLAMFGNAGIGAAQAVPYMRMLDRIESMVPGSITDILKSGAQTSIEQVAIQGLSKVGENGIAKLVYDKDQGLFDGVVQSAQVAAIVGGMLGIGGGVAAFSNPAARAALADRLKQSTPDEIDAFVNRTGKTRGAEWRDEIDDFLRQQAAKEAQSAPSPESPAEPAPAPNPAAAPGDTTGKSDGVASPPNGRATAQPGDATLRGMGWGDEEIALMGAGQRASELAKAAQEGISVPDEPTGADQGLGTTAPAASENSPDAAKSATDEAPAKPEEPVLPPGYTFADEPAPADTTGGITPARPPLDPKLTIGAKRDIQAALDKYPDDPRAAADFARGQAPPGSELSKYWERLARKIEEMYELPPVPARIAENDLHNKPLWHADALTNSFPEGAPQPANDQSFAPRVVSEGEGKPAPVDLKGNKPTGFTTAKGSTYELHEDGTTTRNKAARSDVGHEGDSGPKPRSQSTVYLNPEDAQRLAPPQGRFRVVFHNNTPALHLATPNSGGGWGISPDQRNVPYSTTPRVGSIPLEMWGMEPLNGHASYSKAHFGNPITELHQANEPAANQEQPTGTSPSKPSKAEKPHAPQTLLSFIRAAGGIKDVGGNLRAAGLHRYPGLINNKKGMDPDRAREAAAEGGYLGADRDHAHSNTTPDDLTNALLNHPTYSTFDEEQLHQWKAAKGLSEQREKDYGAALDAIHADQVENGVLSHQVSDEYLHEAARLHVDEGVPIVDAYERAVMQDAADYAGPEKAYEADPDIPWSDYETPAQTPRTEESSPPGGQVRHDGERGNEPGAQGARKADSEGPAHGSDSERKPAEESLDGVEVDAATKVKGGLHDGEFTVVARRQKPFSAERGFGKTPAEARADALRRLGITEKPAEEAGAEGKPQLVIPGAEKIGDGDLAQIKADENLKPKAPQKDTDGLSLFNDSSKQTDLLDMPAAAKPEEKPYAKMAQDIADEFGMSKGEHEAHSFFLGKDEADGSRSYVKVRGTSKGVLVTAHKGHMEGRVKSGVGRTSDLLTNIADVRQEVKERLANLGFNALSPLGKRVLDEMVNIAGYGARGYIADIRHAMPDVPRAELDKALLEINAHEASNAYLMHMDNPRDKRAAEANAGAVDFKGEPKQLFWVNEPKQSANDDRGPTQVQIGISTEGHPLYEDENGVRSIVRNGVRVTQPVEFAPSGEVIPQDDERFELAGKPKLVESAPPIIEAPPAGQKTLSPFDPSKGVPDAVADHLYRGEAFADIRAARKFVKENGGDGLNPKQMEEAIEHGVVKAARAIVVESKTPAETYDRLVALYANQPRLGTRTSTSVEQQAYSTPAPLAYIASRLAHASEGWVLEPTAGNGMLLIEVDPKLQSTTTNELNPDRTAALKEQGFEPTSDDASDLAAFVKQHRKVDVVIANPPFGVVKDANGRSKRFDMADVQLGYHTNEIDHAISIHALNAMKDNGRAVLILGGINKLVKGNEKRSDAYHGKAKREFFHVLYNRYNVTDHFTVAGELYEKQGAGWPIDVIAISGRGKSARKLPSVDVPPVLRSWDELKEKLNVAPDRSPRGEDNDAPGLASQRPEPAGPRALDAEHPSNDGGVGHPTGDPAERPEGVRSGRGSGQSGDSGTAGESRPEVRSDGERNAGPASELSPTGRDDGVKAQAPARQEQETEGQAAYRPKSEKIRGLGTLVPKNMRRATEEALAKVAKKQSVEEYVASKLGMKPDFKGPDGKEYFAAEQIDALALAIHNLEKGSGFIIGDQTGIGKGRVNAAIIRYAIQKQLTPIFVTEKPNLYADMYRDLTDIGIQSYLGREPNILATDSNFRLPLDEDGKIILKTADAKTHGQLLSDVGSKGTLSDHDMVFTTYSQMQTVKGAVTRRQTALRGLAPRAILILDESHNAGGNAAANENPDPNKQSRSAFARDLVNAAQGVFYSSATYAKRPDVMDLYSKTDMTKAVDKPSDLGAAMAQGGIPMQQVVASMLAEAGQYIRRERSFAGVTYDAKTVPVKRDVYNNFSKSISKIHEFSETTKGAIRKIGDKVKDDAQHVTPDGSTGGAGVVSTNFTSIMHNLVSQLLLAMKVKPAVEIALEALKQGEKPVLTVANTMESFLSEYAERLGINPGDPIAISFSDLLQRYLDRTRTITIKKPFSKEKGERHYLTDAELGPAGVAAYKRAQKEIASYDFGALPLSPLDYMKDELTRAGYKVTEITGRKSGISYADTDTTTGNSPKAPRYYLRSQKATSIAGRRQAIKDFNGGNADVMILNQAGATGLSIHAGEKFKDQRRRHMMLVQPEANVDTHMQMLGRVHRTGQVIEPKYSQLLADIPAEKRPGAVLAKKMASLNASTTAARDGALTAKTVVDFMNQYGDEVATRLMAENPDLNHTLGDPVDPTASSPAERDGAVRTLTGRIPLLPIERQEEVYDQLESDYKSLLEEKEAAGENGLEAKRLDLDARPISSLVVREGSGDNPFTQPVKLETLDVKRQSKPYTAANLIEDAAKSVELTPHDDPSTALKQIEDAGRKQNALQAKAARDAFKTFSKELLADIENEQTLINSRARLDDIEKRYTDLMDVARVGNQVSVLNDDQRFSGVITKVYREGKAQNPLALGSWKVKLAIPGQGQVPFAFSRLYTSAKPVGHEDETFYRLEASLPDSNLLNHFDEMSKEGREQRIMLTGNLLAAYAFKKGQIVHFTDHTGDVRQGVLLPGSVKTADDVMAGKGVPLKGAQAVFDELKARPDGVLAAVSDAALVLLRDPRTGTLTISVASSKAKGGHYFLDRELRTIAEADFIKFGPTMRLTIPTSGNQLGAIDRLLAKGAKFEKKGATPPTAAGRVGKVESDPRITPEMEKAVDDALMAAGIARRIAGEHADVKITLNKIETPAELRRASGDEDGNVVGVFDSETKRLLIRAATGEEKRTAFHEAFHAIDSADAFQPHERAVMNRELPAMRDHVAKVYDIPPEKLRHMPDHEIRAYAFEEYADRIEREEPNVGSGIHIGLRRIFDKVISFLRKLRNMLEGHGFQNKDDVFERARKGEVGDRQAGPRAGSFQNGPTSAAKIIKPKVPRYFDNEPFLDRVKRKIRDGIDPTAMKEGWLDLSARVEKMQRDLQAQGNTIGPGQDVYKAKRLLPGKTAARSIDFDRDYVKTLAAEAKAAGLTRQDIAEYMFARHAPERNARMDQIDPNNNGRGSGITDAEAQKILNRLGRDGKLAALQKIEPRIDAIREFELNTLLNSGVISPEQYDAVRDQYQHYAPLRGWEDPDLVPEGTYRQTGGGKLQVKGREWQQAFGRKSISDDPLANLISQAHRAIERAERNNVGATMWRLLKSLPKADLDAIAQLDKGHQTKVLDETTGQVRYVQEPGWRHREDAFAFKIGGKPHYIVFHDPKLAQGLNRLHPDQLPTWLRPVAAFINLEKSLWTHYSPDFVFRHFFMRYPAEAFGNAGEDGIGAMFRTLKGYPGGPAFQALIKADRMNAIERADLAQKFATGKATKAERLQHYYHEMRAAGGLMKFADIAGPERIKNKLDTALARLDKNPVKAIIAMMRTAHEAVDHMTNALDNAQRLAVYAEARDKGATPSDAAMKAREATVDFALKGTHQKLINIMWPFGNTAGQTASRSVRAIRRSSNYRKMVFGLMALGAAQALYNYLYGGNDPKDGKPYFEKLADYTRRLNFVFMTPLKDANGRPYAMTWSLPYFFSLPFTAGSAVMQLALKAAGIAKEPAGAILTNVMHSALEALTPVSQEETLIGKVTPEPFRGLLHAYLNKNFAGYALYTEHPRAGLARSEQGRPSTPDVWKSIASGANRLTGGSRYEGGGLDFYPEAWREVIGNPTSTMERLFKHTHDAIDDIAHGRNPNIDDVPIARTMARGDKAYDQADRSSYYEERNKAFAAEAAYKKAASEGDSAAAQRIAKESGHEIALAKLFRQSQGLIANLYKQRDAIDRAKSLSSDEKEKRKRDLSDRELKIMNQVRQTAEQTAAH